MPPNIIYIVINICTHVQQNEQKSGSPLFTSEDMIHGYKVAQKMRKRMNNCNKENIAANVNTPCFTCEVDISGTTPLTSSTSESGCNLFEEQFANKDDDSSDLQDYEIDESVIHGACFSDDGLFDSDDSYEFIEGIHVCKHCPRTVPHPEKRYTINVVAYDATGTMDIILGDREVRTLMGKRARDIINEATSSTYHLQGMSDSNFKAT
ncbi:hypothetical protein POM88_004907 [Heracleum sosnowskyi]|uniref:Uncharacterized protein n=1 Tax=Heracleum sosnowskyi TaxID=360622 RepID=A0AAD8NDX8_9APIA|nr:hypothetical protein POM88_004907 [Heracleum sosnowskyi]